MLFNEEIAELETQEPELTILYWFVPERRFLCENGRIMIRYMTQTELEKSRVHYALTRIKTVRVTITDDEILVQGTSESKTFSIWRMEEKARHIKNQKSKIKEFG